MAKIQEVSPAESSSTDTPLEQVQNHDENDVFANVRRHSEQPESINDTYVLEKDDSNVIPDHQIFVQMINQLIKMRLMFDERDALANIIAHLTLDTEENKTDFKSQLKKANASLTQELKSAKLTLIRLTDARTKKPKVVPISASKPKRKANKSVATPHKKTVASDTTIQKSKSYYKELYENTNQEWKWWIAKRCPTGNDFLTSSRRSDLYTISLQETTSSLQSVSWLKLTTQAMAYGIKDFSHLNSIQSRYFSKKDVYEHQKFSKTFAQDYSTQSQAQVRAARARERAQRPRHEFLNKTLHAYFKEEGIEHQTSTPRTPKQNGVVERRNRTLVEAARTMLSASKLPLSFWAEAETFNKTSSHLWLHCYITRDGENLDKMKEKGDPCVMFDEIKEMMSDHNSSDLAPQRQEMSVENVSSGLVPQGQKASDYDNSDPRSSLETSSWKSNHAIQTRRQLATYPEMCMMNFISFARLKVPRELVDKPFGKMDYKASSGYEEQEG
ncbi:retrovirus-related pol polyprotein from transposon TNT 1-94 [Tanacetum coccineum]